MGLCFTETHHVMYYECDFMQQMTIPMLISTCIKTSETQSNHLNQHHPTIVNDHGLGWVITQYDIHIQRLPHQNETIFITTKAQEYNKFFCYRDFFVHDQEGNELATIHSIFVLMDLETRRIVSVPKDIISVYQAEKISKLKPFPKIPSMEQTDYEKQYTVRYFDIDGNGHVNNANYFTWCMDSLPFEFLSSHRPVQLTICFDHEVEYGAEVTSQSMMKNTTTYHRIMNQETAVARAIIQWTEIEHVN